MLLAELGSIVLGVSLVAAVTLIVPLVGLGWAIVQAWTFVVTAHPLARTAAILKRRAGRFALRVPSFRSEATVLAGSGFMGVAVGGALPAAGLAPFIAHLPPFAVPLLVPVILIATGQLGLNPVAVVALLGAGDARSHWAFGISPAVLAFACMLGWGPGGEHDADVRLGHHHRPLGRGFPLDRQHRVERDLHLFRPASVMARDRGDVHPFFNQRPP